MKRYSGDLLTILGNQRSENVPLRDCAYEVQLIDAHDIIPNSKNFYGIREVEELATRMRITGHITPLEVVAKDDDPGKYTLISGERRRAAMLFRLEQGEIEKAVMPCIVREDLNGTDALTAEDIEAINIIGANDYRDKTPFEKLDEVVTMRPIARKLWEKAKAEEEEGKHLNDFRAYFAREILGISPSSLQRITMLENLVPEARTAYEDGLMGKSVLYELAYKSDEEQTDYIDGLKTGENAGTVAEVQGKDKPHEEEAEEEPETTEVVAEAMVRPQEDIEEPPKAEAQPEKSSEASRSLDMAEAEEKARQWVREGLQRLVEEAAEKMEAAKAREDSADAALWDLRRAAANLAIEAMS